MREISGCETRYGSLTLEVPRIGLRRIRVISSETNSLDQRPFVEDRAWIQIKPSGQAKFSPYCQISWTPGSILLAKSELPGQRATSVQGVAIHPGRNAERALEGLCAYPRIEVLYWMHQARRDLLIQVPRVSGKPFGMFALRSPTQSDRLFGRRSRVYSGEYRHCTRVGLLGRHAADRP